MFTNNSENIEGNEHELTWPPNLLIYNTLTTDFSYRDAKIIIANDTYRPMGKQMGKIINQIDQKNHIPLPFP